MGENIDPTWVVWRLERPVAGEVIQAGLERVRVHYARLVDYRLAIESQVTPRAGIAVIGDAEPRCRWPHFASSPELAIATSYVPTGWERLTGAVPLAEAPLTLARRIAAGPDDAAGLLNAPAAVAVLDPRAERLTIVNDAIGAARLYEMRLPRGRIWSNRPGALPIFAGTEPAADERGWMILAAASWFLADSSPIEGVRRLAPATVVVADEEVSERRSKRAGEWVQAKRGELHELAREAASQAEAQARAAAEIWPGRADVDLSGGRDSRLSAAATVAAGIDARYQTSDSVPGEAKAAQAVIAAAPRELEHKVRNKKAGSATPGTPLLDRARNLHLLHDGVRHPQKLRGKMTLPRPRPNTATFSGHGGEIAHGFFYKNAAELRGARRKRGRSDRVMRFFAKDHEAATADAYAEARAAVESTFARGQEHGLRGAVLLDWFYLVDRFAHRSGIATDSERISVFATPAFVRAAFSLKPRDRLGNVLHDFVIASLVPEWSDVPFFEAKRSRMPKIRRHRLWEVVEDAAVVEDILAEEGPWSRVYDAERARASWNELKRGGGSAKWEPIFEGIVFRHTYDDHLRTLADAARADGKSLADALATNA